MQRDGLHSAPISENISIYPCGKNTVTPLLSTVCNYGFLFSINAKYNPAISFSSVVENIRRAEKSPAGNYAKQLYILRRARDKKNEKDTHK